MVRAIQVDEVVKAYPVDGTEMVAVNHVSFNIEERRLLRSLAGPGAA